MKQKIFTSARTALLLVAVLSMTAACSSKSSSETTGNDTDTPTDSAARTDVATRPTESATPSFDVKNVKSKLTSKGISVAVDIDYPVSGNDALVAGVRKAIIQDLGLKASAEKEQPQAIADQAAKTMLGNLKEMRSEEGLEDYPDAPDYEESCEIKLDGTTDKFVTFLLKGYSYYGGAHGMSGATYSTFDVKTGKKLTWDDIFAPSVRKKLLGLVRRALVKQYYNGDGTSLDVLAPFALPEQAPHLTEKGVAFHYGLYEIDSYAAGMPECVVPYSHARELMTDYARTLIP